jgi:hypothetical protein
MRGRGLGAAIVVAAAAVAAAGDDPLSGFTAAGEVRRCVYAHEISETRVVDDRTILFRLGARRFYVNRLGRDCGGLKVQGKFAYTLRGGNELCRGDVIRVLETGSTGAACLLGSFEKLEKKAAPRPSAR